ncbi:MAG: carboxypeptidase-like regulatory domain-containing protein, partial [Acidobacteriota bacterium]
MRKKASWQNGVSSGSAKLCVGLLLTGIFFIAGTFAQSENGSASLEGTVKDQNGAVIQGATVVVQNTGTNLERTVITNTNGTFTVNVLPVGTYNITTKSTGFGEMPVQVTLKVGETTPIEIVLEPQSANVLVEVNADSQTIDTETQSTGTVISPRLVEDLPVRGRNFTEFVQLTPAVVQESDRNGLVIAGQRSINSNVAIDGADFNDA